VSAVSIAGRAPWLAEPHLQALLSALDTNGEEARVVGGAVRNALFGIPVTDIDIATTNLPDATIARAEAAGFKAVPTGKVHGTITVVSGGKPYEVTTLRADTETDGRWAKVAFGRDWQADAERRDFTINGLYCDAQGTVLDLVGGLADIETRTLRFIGNAEDRIREDYLRILRFFRFFAWYGASRPDAEGVKACARLKDGMARLSAERIWAELRKLLSAPDPSRALLWMRQTSVLSTVLPESEKWGIDAIHGLVAAEQSLGWIADPMLRFEAILPPDAARLSALAMRLKLSNDERGRLEKFAMTGVIRPDWPDAKLREMLYFGDAQALRDALALRLSAAQAATDLEAAANYARLFDQAARWTRPDFPVDGDDLVRAGMKPGKELGALLRRLEKRWVESGFALTRETLLAAVAAKG
jgi:tRNA nucleotidyltransferase/poly(A) polymerase